MQDKSTYFTNTRSEMLDYVPLECKNILEIGCGEGIFSGLLKKRSDVTICGVEPDEKSAKVASQVLDRVIVSFFDQALPQLEENSFDCIIFNDVIEHFTDPDFVLQKCRNLLKKGGYIVSSIPNVRYVGNLMELLVKKDWEYKSYGILDETHYRFYTEKSICRLFEKNGYKVQKINGVNPTHSLKVKLFILLTLGHSKDIKYMQFASVCQVNK